MHQYNAQCTFEMIVLAEQRRRRGGEVHIYGFKPTLLTLLAAQLS